MTTQDAVPDLSARLDEAVKDYEHAVGNPPYVEQSNDWLMADVAMAHGHLFKQAADAIAALRAQVADLRGRLTAPTSESAERVADNLRRFAETVPATLPPYAMAEAWKMLGQQAREIARLQSSATDLGQRWMDTAAERNKLRAECDALRADAIPRAPTEEMEEAGCDAFLARNENRFAIFTEDIRAVWFAMYDAARQAAGDP